MAGRARDVVRLPAALSLGLGEHAVPHAARAVLRHTQQADRYHHRRAYLPSRRHWTLSIVPRPHLHICQSYEGAAYLSAIATMVERFRTVTGASSVFSSVVLE